MERHKADAPEQAARHSPRGRPACPHRGYDADWIRAFVNQQGAWAKHTPKMNRKDPIRFSPHLYRARNLVERFFNKIKQCRRIATCYDKFLAFPYLCRTLLTLLLSRLPLSL